MKRKGIRCWACEQLGHFAANCPTRRCRFCGEPGHLRRSCPQRKKIDGLEKAKPQVPR